MQVKMERDGEPQLSLSEEIILAALLLLLLL